MGQELVFDASGSTDPDGHPLTFRWDFNDGTTATGARVTHAFQKIGPHSIGVTVSNGRFSDLAYCDFLAYEDVPEPATEGHAADWSWEELEGRNYQWHVPRGQKASDATVTAVANPKTKIEISDDREVHLVGNVSLGLRVAPASEAAIRLLYPRTKNAGIPLAGKTSLDFWVKTINNNTHAWKGLHAHGDDLRVAHQVLPTPAERRPEELAGRPRLDPQEHPAARQRSVESRGRGPRHHELDDHRVLPVGRRAVPSLARRHDRQVTTGDRGKDQGPGGTRLSPPGPFCCD